MELVSILSCLLPAVPFLFTILGERRVLALCKPASRPPDCTIQTFRSRFREPAKDAVRVSAIGKLRKVHVGNGEIVLDATGLAGNHAESPTRFVHEVDNDNRMFWVCHGELVNNEDEATIWTALS